MEHEQRGILTETVMSSRKVLERLPDPVAEDHAGLAQKTGKIWIAWKIWEERQPLKRVAFRTLILSTLIVFLIPVSYESVTRVLPSDAIPRTGGVLSALAGLGSSSSSGAASLLDVAGEALGSKNTGAMYVALLRSRTVQENLVRKFDLMKVYHARYIEVARKTLDHNTEITEDRKSYVISLTVTDHDQNRARNLAQGYVEELNNLLAHVTTSSAGQQRVFLEHRLSQVKKDLDTAENKFSQYASKNATLDLPEQTRAMVESGAVLQAEVIAAQSELQGLQEVYTPNNVRVRAAQARLAELQRKLQQLGGVPTGSAPASSGAQEEQLYPPIRQLPLLGVEWANLYREVKVQETLFQLLTTQYELARMEEARQTPVLNIVDPANFPERKSFPPRLVLIAASTLLCLILATIWIFVRERWQNTNYDDPSKLLFQTMGHAIAAPLRKFFGRIPWLKNFPSKRVSNEP